MKVINNCPLCGSEKQREVAKAPHFRGSNEKFSIAECGACGFWFSSPRPEDDDLGRYYDAENYDSHRNDKSGIIDRVYYGVRQFAAKSKLGLIESLHPEKGSILDIGAGSGFFLSVMKEANWSVSGMEPEKVGRESAAELGIELRASLDDFNGESFGAITLWHVLEHLPNLKGDFQKLMDLLEPNGHLIIAVPNRESYDAKIYGDSWAALDMPIHLYHFRKRDIKALAEEYNMEVVQIKNMRFDSFYVSMLSEKIKNNKGNLPKAFITGLKSNLKAGSDNASSLIYVLKKK